MTNRSCHVCGKRYYYCSSYNCTQSRDKPRWMTMFDDENCRNIWKIIGDEFQGRITALEAKKALLQCDLTELDTFVAGIRNDVVRLLDTPDPAVEKEKLSDNVSPEKKSVTRSNRRRRRRG